MLYPYPPDIISANIHPTLQMSTGLLYEEWSSISGALYHCVTTCHKEEHADWSAMLVKVTNL